jgi:hypothetical protein
MPAGRPLKYKTPEEMQRAIDLYFIACKSHQSGDEKLLEDLTEEELLIINDIDDFYPTVTGLALALDLTRQSLIDYEHKDEFLDTIKRAKTKIEAAVEQRLYLPNATGSIFNLKNNFGWKDKTETEIDATVKTEDVSAKDVVAKFLESKS